MNFILIAHYFFPASVPATRQPKAGSPREQEREGSRAQRCGSKLPLLPFDPVILYFEVATRR